MTQLDERAAQAAAPGERQTFDSLDPATGDVVGTHPVHTEEDVRAAVARAREEAAWWSSLSFDERERHLQTWKGVITRRLAQLADLVHREMGKPHADAMLEAGLAVDHLAWAASHAGKVLGRRRVSSGLLMANQAATLEYRPLGVVGVIGPWNYPRLHADGLGRLRPGRRQRGGLQAQRVHPGLGEWLARTFAESVGRPVLQVVTGLGETGAALCRAGVDKVAFTGSTATGKRVMATCAETLTPVIIEAGGKDAVIVDEDADVEAAADAALWGACSNAGQTCIGVERVYVHERVYDEFLGELVAKARQLRADADPDSLIGPMTMPSQVDVVRSHIQDALDRGGRAVVGGPDGVGERFIQPTVLVDVPEDSTAVQEETFGPVVTVTRVSDMDDAIARVNGTRYGLGSAVFAGKRAMEIAERIRAGMTSINGVISFAGIPALPFGGVGDSGFGRIHGADGLREFTYPHAIARQRFKPPMALTTFTRTSKVEQQFAQLLTMLHGRGTTLPAPVREAGRRFRRRE